MLFNSFEFFIFFPLVTIIYFLLPQKYRWFHLLAASCLFYCAFIPVYILILFFTIIIDYVAGIVIENARGQRRKVFLAMSIVANVGVLAVFKYYNFLVGNFNWVMDSLHLTYNASLLNIILPIGLSFHTFQAMSYTIEVFRGNQKAERHFGIYALYVMFYPQLVAGPIERPQNLLWQFRRKFDFDYDRVTSGLKLMAWGLFKKVVIADRLSTAVNAVYNNPGAYEGLPLIVATVFFSIQIYCDFSGYSDIAIGSARVMGFTLMKNFDRPYYSKSISEFWKRWHISLSTWFRDYFYISLGGNRVPVLKRYMNLFLTFMVSGLWHGASWNFVIWGSLHGTYLIFGILLKPVRAAFNKATGIDKSTWLMKIIDVAVVYILVTFAWIFFRATTFETAWYVITHLFSIHEFSVNGLMQFLAIAQVKGLYSSALEWKILIAALMVMECVHWIQRKNNPAILLSKYAAPVRMCVYTLLMLAIALFGVFGKNQFIYFQF